MPTWDNARFAELEERVMATVTGRRPLLDVPYYILTYDPGLELRCLKECEALCKRLQARGHSAQVISLAAWLVDALEALGCLAPAFYKVEAKDRATVGQDLERELPKLLAERLALKLAGKDQAHCAVLVRTGALFPFVHVSTLLSAIEGHVRCTLVVAYPGGKEGETLRFLNETNGSYYRAEVL
jgi:hypothetical protein